MSRSALLRRLPTAYTLFDRLLGLWDRIIDAFYPIRWVGSSSHARLALDPLEERAMLSVDQVQWGTPPSQLHGGAIYLQTIMIERYDFPSPGLPALNVKVSFGGDAVRGVDYVAKDTVTISAGSYFGYMPIAVLDTNAPKTSPGRTVTYTIVPGTGYTLEGSNPTESTLLLPAAGSPPLAVTPSPCGCPCVFPTVIPIPGMAAGDVEKMMSDYPVRVTDGVASITATDIESDGFGDAWGVSRSWSNNPTYAAGSDAGNGWVDARQPHLIL